MNSYTCKPSATEKSERFFHFCCYSWGQTAYLNIGISQKIPWNYRHTENGALSTNIEDLKGSFLAIYFLSLDCYRIAGGRTKCKLLQQQNKLNINVYSNWWKNLQNKVHTGIRQFRQWTHKEQKQTLWQGLIYWYIYTTIYTHRRKDKEKTPGRLY